LVAKHSAATKYGIDFDRTDVIANIYAYHTRIIREANEITKHPHNINYEDDYRLS
jgi:hypothetical protein